MPSIDGEDRENIGTINAPTAIREAYPGAIYRHNGLTYRVTKADPDATELVFYSAKALANDHLIRWKSVAEAANMYPESIQQITGDTPMRLREQLLNGATVALLPPTWSMHGSSEQPGPPPKSAFPPTSESPAQTRHTSTKLARNQRSLHVPAPGRSHDPGRQPLFHPAQRRDGNHPVPLKTHAGPHRTHVRKVDLVDNGAPLTPLSCSMCRTPRTRKTRNSPSPAPGLDHRQRAPGPGIPLPGPWAECRAQRRHGPPGRFSARRTPPD